MDTRCVQTVIAMHRCRTYPWSRPSHLERSDRDLGAGIGSPYQHTTAARAAEIEADAILMAKNGVDGGLQC